MRLDTMRVEPLVFIASPEPLFIIGDKSISDIDLVAKNDGFDDVPADGNSGGIPSRDMLLHWFKNKSFSGCIIYFDDYQYYNPSASI